MGWTAVEPLSLGFFQIDPNAMQLNAEGNLVLAAGAGGASKAAIKAIYLAIKKSVKEMVEKVIKAAVKGKVTLKIGDDVGEGLTEQAMKNVDAKTFPSGLTGKELSEQFPGSYMAAVKKETGNLAVKQVDNLAAASKGGLKEVVGEGGEITIKKGGAEVTEKGVVKGGSEVLDEAAEAAAKAELDELAEAAAKENAKTLADAAANPKGLGPKTKAFMSVGTRFGMLGGGIWIIHDGLMPLADSLGDAAGDAAEGLLAPFNAENCRANTEMNYPNSPELWDEKTEECVSKVALRTTILGVAGFSAVGLLIFGLATYLLPKAKNHDESEE